MVTLRVRCVQTLPAHQLCAPRHVRVLAVDEEIGIEEFAPDLDVVDHFAAVKRSGRSGAEYIFVVAEMAVVNLEATPVQMAQVGREIDTGRVDRWLFGEIEGRRHCEQFSANGANFRVQIARSHQCFNEAGQQ